MSASLTTLESVERKLGHCLLRLQDCELLLKSLVANTEIIVQSEQLPNPHEARGTSIQKQTMGTLVGMLTTGTLMQAGITDIHSKRPDDSSMGVWFEYRIELDAEQYDTLCSALRDLVDLRNNLVHHFLQRFDIRHAESRAAANNYLDECSKIIDGNSLTLRSFANALKLASRELSSFVETQEFEDAVQRADLPD